jgi:hypothetical protein
MGVCIDLTNGEPYHSCRPPSGRYPTPGREERRVSSEEDRRQVEEDRVEDLEVDKDSAESITGGGTKFEITQDVTVNKAKTADKAFQAMDGYIRG